MAITEVERVGKVNTRELRSQIIEKAMENAKSVGTVNELGNAFAAVGNKGGTVPASKVSSNLADAINSISSGVTVQVKTGTVTGVSGTAKTVNLGFKPDAVFFTGTEPYSNSKVHAGVAFTEANVTSVGTFFAPPSTSYVYSSLTVGQTSTGFTVKGVRINTSFQTSNESNRYLSYIAIKYTE